jgi:hypothetical protein
VLTRFIFLLVASVSLAACGASTTPDTSTETVYIPSLTVEGALGSACNADDDCAAGTQCDRTVPGGQCTSECSANADCGADGVCFEGWCLLQCQSQRQCRSAEFDCYGVPDTDYGICAFNLAAVTPAAPNIGAPCRALVECAAPEGVEAFCMPQFGSGGVETPFVGGMCLAAGCTDNADCGDGARCIGAENMRVCMPACDETVACRDGYVCTEGACAPGPR